MAAAGIVIAGCPGRNVSSQRRDLGGAEAGPFPVCHGYVPCGVQRPPTDAQPRTNPRQPLGKPSQEPPPVLFQFIEKAAQPDDELLYQVANSVRKVVEQDRAGLAN